MDATAPTPSKQEQSGSFIDSIFDSLIQAPFSLISGAASFGLDALKFIGVETIGSSISSIAKGILNIFLPDSKSDNT